MRSTFCSGGFYMNTNLAVQKPTSYEYQKPKYIGKTKNRPHRYNSIYSIISIVLIVISSYFITHDFYVSINSQNLYYAVEYNFTNNNDINNSLLRVKYMTLISSDGKNAVVEVSGLSKSRPHHTISLEGSFSKDNNNSWKLKEIKQN